MLGHGRPAAARYATTPRSCASTSAGAIVIGKTRAELMLWPFTETLTFGVTRNPWNLDHTPGGSSGSSAAATATGLCGRVGPTAPARSASLARGADSSASSPNATASR